MMKKSIVINKFVYFTLSEPSGSGLLKFSVNIYVVQLSKGRLKYICYKNCSMFYVPKIVLLLLIPKQFFQ